MNRIPLCLLILAFGVLTACAQPAQVILLRHGEEPRDANALHLSARGRERARALVALLGRHSPLATNAPVAALYATRVTKRGRSQRTGETLAPLAKELGLTLNTSFDSANHAALAATVLHNPAYRGQTVIICWVHHDLAQLANALGVRPAPPPWQEGVFDRLWVIDYGSNQAELRDLPQRLLKGDAKR